MNEQEASEWNEASLSSKLATIRFSNFFRIRAQRDKKNANLLASDN